MNSLARIIYGKGDDPYDVLRCVSVDETGLIHMLTPSQHENQPYLGVYYDDGLKQLKAIAGIGINSGRDIASLPKGALFQVDRIELEGKLNDKRTFYQTKLSVFINLKYSVDENPNIYRYTIAEPMLNRTGIGYATDVLTTVKFNNLGFSSSSKGNSILLVNTTGGGIVMEVTDNNILIKYYHTLNDAQSQYSRDMLMVDEISTQRIEDRQGYLFAEEGEKLNKASLESAKALEEVQKVNGTITNYYVSR